MKSKSILNFCINCGARATISQNDSTGFPRQANPVHSESSGFCVACAGDPAIPDSVLLQTIANNPRFLPTLRDPAETVALIAGLLVGLGLLAFLGALSFGIILAGVLLAFASLVIEIVSLHYSAARTTWKTHPRLNRLAQLAAWRLGCRVPRVFLRESRDRNAFALGGGRWPTIVLNAVLVEDFTDEELLFIIGHEAGHLASGHTLVQLFTGSLSGKREGVSKFSRLATLPFHLWHHRAELAADRAGLIACNSLSVASDTLAKLATGTTSCKDDLCRAAEQQARTPLSRLFELASTHPYPARRIAHLTRFAHNISAE